MGKIKAFLFKNENPGQTILKNTLWLTISEIITRLAKFFLVIFIIRILGATEYGKFAFAFSFISLLGIFFDFGISAIVIREFAKDKKQEKYLPDLIGLKIILEVIGIFLIVIGSFFVTPDLIIRKSILVLGAYFLLAEFGALFYALLRSRQKMEYEAFFKIFQALVLLGTGFVILFRFPSIIGLSWAYLISSALALVLILFLSAKFFSLKIGFRRTTWKYFLSMSWPIVLIGALGTIYNSTDSVMMGLWKQMTATGLYNAVYKIIGVIIIPGTLLTQSFYPALSSKIKEIKKFQKVWHFKIKAMIFLSLPILTGGLFLAREFVGLLYGPKFFPAILAFKILLLSAAIIYLYLPYGQALIIFNQQKKLFWAVLGGAILNVVLNAFLIPRYSLYGAASATVATHALLLFSMIFMVKKYTRLKILNWSLIKIFIFALLASSLMLICLNYLKLSLIPSILAGGAIYCLSLGFLNFKEITHYLWSLKKKL